MELFVLFQGHQNYLMAEAEEKRITLGTIEEMLRRTHDGSDATIYMALGEQLFTRRIGNCWLHDLCTIADHTNGNVRMCCPLHVQESMAVPKLFRRLRRFALTSSKLTNADLISAEFLAKFDDASTRLQNAKHRLTELAHLLVPGFIKSVGSDKLPYGSLFALMRAIAEPRRFVRPGQPQDSDLLHHDVSNWVDDKLLAAAHSRGAGWSMDALLESNKRQLVTHWYAPDSVLANCEMLLLGNIDRVAVVDDLRTRAATYASLLCALISEWLEKLRG